jgi:hypothetical protein
VYLNNPRRDGLSDGIELDTLIRIEENLCERLLTSCGAVLAGCITTEGRREFYFYGEHRKPFEAAVNNALVDFEGYRFDTGAQEDSNWNQYTNVLYPSDSDLRRMKIRDVQ